MPFPFPKTSRPLLAALLGACAALLAAAPAQAQLRETEVLVVYDSRIPDSLAVAEYYAGSAKVPGGAGSLAGIHPRVSVVDLSTRNTAAPVGPAGFATAVPDISYADFTFRLRDPLRTFLIITKSTRRIRCIVMTKGLPHRIQNMNTALPVLVGDDPSTAFNNANYRNATFASVDSELTLLYQNLSNGEHGGNGDSRADGMILNPYWRSNLPAPDSSSPPLPACPIDAWPSYAITASKSFVFPSVAKYLGDTSYDGFQWFNSGTNAGLPTVLTPGDLYLVCRLDGNTVADVKAMIDRAQNLVVPMNTAAVILDGDSISHGGDILDNTGETQVNAGADFTLTKNLLTSDGRLNSANIYQNYLSGVTGFVVGPNLTFAGTPIVVSAPVILLASFGSNHDGITGTQTGYTYATSFNLLPGAIFNSQESFNGRGYGSNYFQFTGQQQTADFLANHGAFIGGTFAIGNVWEPLAETIADNEQLARNFLLGNLSWAEAAYTALPVISWQQIVLGDPLARVRRDREDINNDGQVNIDDLYAWRQNPVNLNNTGAADNTDFLLLESTVRANELTNMKGDQR